MSTSIARTGKWPAVASVLLTAAVLLPIAWLLVVAVAPKDAIANWPGRLLFTPSLSNFTGLANGPFFLGMRNSVAVSALSTIVAVLLGTPAAYALSRLSLRSRRWTGYAVLASRMAPPIALAIPFFLAFKSAGLVDTVFGMVVVYTSMNLSLVIWTLQPHFETVPATLEEAARIDGASELQMFLRVVLPVVLPGVVATAVLAFLYAWNDFFLALVLTRNRAITAPVSIVNFLNYEGWEWGKIAAAGVLVMAPALLISTVLRRFMVSGVLSGAIKD